MSLHWTLDKPPRGVFKAFSRITSISEVMDMDTKNIQELFFEQVRKMTIATNKRSLRLRGVKV